MRKSRKYCSYIAGVLMATLWGAGSHAADSVSNGVCLPGDALAPWDVTAQRKDYVVDLVPFQTSWGTEFGIAPIVKSSKSASGFFGSLVSAQSLSRLHATGVPMSGEFQVWESAGEGVNDTENAAPGGSVDVSGCVGNRFALAFAEFATTDSNASYNGVIGATVQYRPDNPSRLFVSRIPVAVNSCDDASNVSQIALGAVDELGHVAFRADDFGVGAACGVTPLSGNNIFVTDMGSRDTSVLNVISNDFPGGLFDSPSTKWLVRNDAVNAHNPPNLIPSALTGGDPLYIGSNFAAQYVRGTDFPTTADGSHLAAGMTNQRGNVSYTPSNCTQLSSTHGIAALLGQDGLSEVKTLNLWGLDSAGSVTGTLALTMPPVITDPTTGATNLGPGPAEFDHYHSQVAFRGGNGQIALAVDTDGHLLAAAVADHPTDGGADWPVNFIPVARVNCGSGAVEWTLAAYNDFTDGAFGTAKPILDGPGGNVIGRLSRLDVVTGGAPFGPSFSAPMIDSAGNVWFLAAIELDDGLGGTIPTNGLIRAVYNPSPFSYELELVFDLGDEFLGANSQTNYRISFLGIADSNSVDSGTAWSQNISSVAHNGESAAALDPSDPRTLGGLIISAEVVYDADNDGDFEQPCGTVGGGDQDYNVLLYIGALEPTSAPPAACGSDNTCSGGANAGRVCATNADCPDGVCGLKSRYLAVDLAPTLSATAGGDPTSIQLQVIDIDDALGDDDREGEIWWAGPEVAILNSPHAPLAGTQVVCEATPSTAAIWSSGRLQIFGEPIVPNSTYAIRQCDASGTNCSAPLLASTGKYGDIVATFGGSGQPNFADITAAVEKFKDSGVAPDQSRTDLRGSGTATGPNVPDGVTNFLDISGAVDSFKGILFPFAAGTCSQ